MLFIALAALFVGLAVFLVAEVATLSARERAGSSAGPSRTAGRRRRHPRRRPRLQERALVPLTAGLARAALRITPRATMESVTLKLHRAGLSRRISATGFLASKAALAVAAPSGPNGHGVHVEGILLGLVFAGVGFMLPDIFLTFRMRSRRETLSAELPDTGSPRGQRGGRARLRRRDCQAERAHGRTALGGVRARPRRGAHR